MSARKMQRARRRAIAAGTAISIGAAVVPPAASADSLVTNNNDAGPGSLRQAVADSNADVDADTITFAPNVTGAIVLNGRLTATRSLTIDGPGSNVLSIVSINDSIINLNDFSAGSSTLELEGLTLGGLTSGAGSGGGVVSAGGRSGGLTIRNCKLDGTSQNQGGAISSKATPVDVINSTIEDSDAGTFGGAIYAIDAAVVITGSTLTANEAGTGGGAIALFEGTDARQSSLSITDSRIAGDTAGANGGGVAVYNADGPTTVLRSTISGGSADGGGGMYFGYGTGLTIDSSTIAGNSASDGGGLLVFAPGGPTTIRNTTVSGNTANSKGAGIYSFGYFDKPVTIANSTIASNSGATLGGGIYRFGYDGQGSGYEGPDEVHLSSTIVANNLATTGPDLADGSIADGSSVLDHTLIGSTSGGAAITESAPGTNKLGTGPLALSPLADNGGPTQTMLPALGGPAIDAGVANGLPADQRGLARTVDQPSTANGAGDGTDIGAAEVADSELSGGKLKAKKKQKQKGKKVVVALSAGAAEQVTADPSGSVDLGKKKLPLEGSEAQIAAGKTAKLKLKPKGKRSAKKIARALAKGKKVKASIAVTLTDGTGNSDQETAKVTLVG